VKAATLHRSDFIQQNVANTKTNNIQIIENDVGMLSIVNIWTSNQF
jgi:hypothetical protein